MKLNKRLFVYMSAIGLAMLIFISIYFTTLVPGLYLSYQKQKSIDLATELHKQFVQERSYKNLSPENKFSTISLVLSKDDHNLYIASKLGAFDIDISSPIYKTKLDGLRKSIEEIKSGNYSEFDNLSIDIELGNIDGLDIKNVEQFRIPENVKAGSWGMKEFGSTKVLYGSLNDDNVEYVSIWAFDENPEEYIITLVPLLYSSIDDILPVLLNMIPTILLALLLMLIIASRLVSKSIIDRVLVLERHSSMLKNMEPSKWTSLNMQGKDEIAELSERLDDMHAEVKRSYEIIQSEKARQELFIRASSHELKTPLASALMLCDSMIANIGKYANHEKYLPELKNILLTMNKMLEELLPLRKSGAYIEDIDMRELFESIADSKKYLIEQKAMSYEITGELYIKSWQDIAERIVNTAIGNAISHGAENSHIKIELNDEGFCIANKGYIDPHILEHAFEPFISSNNSKGHGLGLYIARSYSKILGWQIDIKNKDEGVIFVCKIKK